MECGLMPSGRNTLTYSSCRHCPLCMLFQLEAWQSSAGWSNEEVFPSHWQALSVLWSCDRYCCFTQSWSRASCLIVASMHLSRGPMKMSSLKKKSVQGWVGISMHVQHSSSRGLVSWRPCLNMSVVLAMAAGLSLPVHLMRTGKGRWEQGGLWRMSRYCKQKGLLGAQRPCWDEAFCEDGWCLILSLLINKCVWMPQTE